jgi:hypothetical protein
VYAVWFAMVPGDRRERWPSDLLSDSRVTHFWDEERVVGRFFGEQVTRLRQGLVEWDAWILYDPDSQWPTDGPPTRRVGWGRTIVETREELSELLAPRRDSPRREP